MQARVFILFLLSIIPGVPLAWWGLMFVLMGATGLGAAMIGGALLIWGALAYCLYNAY